MVDQEPVLFAGTIADNIRYGVPLASDDDVQDAARQVRDHSLVPPWSEWSSREVGLLSPNHSISRRASREPLYL